MQLKQQDNYINSFFFLDLMIDFLFQNNNSVKTSKKILENFKNNNVVSLSNNSTQKVNISKFDGNDFDLYSKFTYRLLHWI